MRNEQKRRLREEREGKVIHGAFARETRKPECDKAVTHAWLRNGCFKAKTEGLIAASQDGVIQTAAYCHRILGESCNPICRECGGAVETLGHILSVCESYKWSLYEMCPHLCQHLHGHHRRRISGMIKNQGNPLPSVWIRYIDDIFVIWPHSQNLFLQFFNELNNFHPTIKYTHELSNQSVNFLDITIFKGKRFSDSHILDLAPYFKPTNRFQYLHFDSCHPSHTFKGLILGEAIRMLRASSDPTIFADAILVIKNALIDRKYPVKLINKTLKQITYKDRPKRLQQHDFKKLFPPPGYADFRIPFNPKIPPNRVQAALPQITNNQPIGSVLTYMKPSCQNQARRDPQCTGWGGCEEAEDTNTREPVGQQSEDQECGIRGRKGGNPG